MTMEKEERIGNLEEAQEKIQEAVSLIREAIKGTTQSSGAEAYVIPSLEMCIGNGHGYMGSQPFNCQDIIDELEEPEEEDDDEKPEEKVKA